MWLKASCTNSNPKTIGSYFVEAVEKVRAYPQLICTDMGTENVTIRDNQLYLLRNDEDDRAGEGSYITGRSTATPKK